MAGSTFSTENVGPLFGISDVGKSHTAVARSAFPSQNAKELTGSDHFLKLRCRKIVWHEAHFRVKMLKTDGFRPLLEITMSKNWALARSTFPSQNAKN